MNQISQYFGKNSKKKALIDTQKQVTVIPRNHKKVAQEVRLRKLMFLRKVLSQLTVEKSYLTAWRV